MKIYTKYAKKAILSIFLIILFLAPKDTYAHLSGQPPFFLINDKYSNLYPVPSTSLSNFNLPQDLAAENYLVNQKLNFEIDTDYLQVPKEIIGKTTFTWDFGDGENGSGLKQTHVYKNQGSYILTINAKYDQIVGSQLIQSVLINVLPDNNYQLPKPVIKINNKQSKDPLVDVLYFPFGDNLTFDATASEAKSSKIISYTWDFGDSQTSDQQKITHNFSKDLPQQQVFPVLRVKDSNGFIADAFVQITNGNSQKDIAASPTSSPKKTTSFYAVLIPTGLLVVIILAIIIKKKKK